MKKNTGAGGASDDGVGVGGNKSDQQRLKGQSSKERNMQRLGGRGLSLQAFARTNHYNPALIKKQREFYKNAKYVRKFKRSLGQHEQQMTARHLEERNETEEATDLDHNIKKRKKNSAKSLRDLYEEKRQEAEKARLEREASIQAKKKERQRAEARRKSLKKKMFKKTKSGQPVMKHRIEHLLQMIQGSTS
ncbi:stress response protein NST1 [Coffea eugenioides]|nr:stress response protein NST1-like [Coffea arabica]XP_027164202.1 stress response protein NST1 [Coffea eugenioides]